MISSMRKTLWMLVPMLAWAQAQTPPDSSAQQPVLKYVGGARPSSPATGDTSQPAATQPPAPSVVQPAADSDTVFVLNRKAAHEVVTTFEYSRRSTSSRKKGYGGCIGPTMGVCAMNMSAVHELMKHVPGEFQSIDRQIEGTYELFSLFGGKLYGGLGNGLRIGLAGAGGSRSYGTPDSVTDVVEIGLGFGGFLIEKSFVARNLNLILGGTIGAGGMGVTLYEGDAFQMNTDKLQASQRGQAGAAFLLLEGHGGFTYSFLPWLHIGAEISVPCFLSSGGFRSASGLGLTNGFYTANPGGQVRIMLGNIG